MHDRLHLPVTARSDRLAVAPAYRLAWRGEARQLGVKRSGPRSSGTAANTPVYEATQRCMTQREEPGSAGVERSRAS